MKEALTLEGITQNNDLVIIDSNVIGLGSRTNNSKKVGEYDNKKLASLSKNLSAYLLRLRENPNILATRGVVNEYYDLLKIITEQHSHPKLLIRNETLEKEYYRNGRLKRAKSVIEIRRRKSKRKGKIMDDILSKVESTRDILEGRTLVNDKVLYSPMLNLVMKIANNMNLITRRQKMHRTSIKTTGEEILASVFSYALLRKGYISVLTNNKRMHLIARVITSLFYSEESLSYNTIDSLEDFPPMFYSTSRDLSRCRMPSDSRNIKTEKLRHFVEKEITSVEKLVPQRKIVSA